MDRTIEYTQEILRSYDFLYLQRYALKGLAYACQDFLGTVSTMVGGLAASQTGGGGSLSINIAAGRIYAQSATDGSGYGTLAADSTVVTQQGIYLGGQVTFTTAGLSSGQSQWALVQATFNQTDVIPADDPTSGILNFYNSANPQVPLIGPGGSGSPLNTARIGVCTLSIVYGSAATTGSEVPPNPSANNVPLYLVDLAFGQTQIHNNQIIVAGPSAGTNVPNNYPAAPFIQGLSTLANPRVRLTQNTDFYVGPNGDNGNTGLGAGNNQAWLTLNHAYNFLVSNYDLAGFKATINVVGNLTAGLTATSAPIGGGTVVIDGGANNISVTNGSCFIAYNGAIISVQNFANTRATGTSPGWGTIIGAANQGTVYVNANMFLGNGTAGGDFADFNAQFGGQIFIQNDYTVRTGTHVIHWRTSNAGEIYANGINITLNSTPACSGSWAYGFDHGDMLIACTFTGTGTGLTANLNMLTTLDTGGALNLPGNGTYTLNTGSQKN